MTAPAWDFAQPHWEQRLREGRSLVPDLPLDHTQADKAVGFFNKLRLPDVVDQPAMEDAAGDWQRDIVRAIFGSLVEGVRMVPEVFCMVPKKNSKTTGGAAIALTALLMNKRPRAQLIFVGPTQEVADLAFEQCAGMIDADPEGYLQRRFHVQDHIKTITDRTNKAKLKIKTFDTKVVTGSKPVFVLLDELHLMGSMNGAGKVITQLRGGRIANPESVLVIITTQSDEPPTGPFKSELSYARRVRDGEVKDGRTLPLLYEFPASMQADKSKPWADPKTWHMVLPNLGRSITLDSLARDYLAALEKGDEEEQRWTSQHLNLEIGLALHGDRWAGADYWPGAVEKVLSFEEILRRSEVVVAGADGGGLDDLFGLGVIGRDKDTKQWLSWCRAWAHERVLERRQDIAEQLRSFKEDGDLVIVDDGTVPATEAAAYIARIKAAGLLPEKYGVGVDPYAIMDLIDALDAAEITGEMIASIKQGTALSPASWGVEIKLSKRTLVHADQPMMDWCVGNARAEQRGNAVLITKQTAGKAKIDPLVALFNAAMLMSRNPTAVRKKRPAIL